jgi:hypothetical protein
VSTPSLSVPYTKYVVGVTSGREHAGSSVFIRSDEANAHWARWYLVKGERLSSVWSSSPWLRECFKIYILPRLERWKPEHYVGLYAPRRKQPFRLLMDLVSFWWSLKACVTN